MKNKYIYIAGRVQMNEKGGEKNGNNNWQSV